MAIPNIDWDEWSQPAIEPFMEAIIHFPTGDVLISDDEISSINFSISMFENSRVLFGPPQPATASMDIVDYDQIYNPLKNSQATDNIQVDLYLGLWPLDKEAILGENIVTSFDQPIFVSYLNEDVWACVVYIDDTFLEPGGRYRLTYTYHFNDSSDYCQNFFDVPALWFERHIYAITEHDQFTVDSVVIQQVFPLKQLYGVFFTQEWSYDTATHITSVDMIDEVSGLLTTDNRLDGPTPSKNVDLHTFIATLLRLYDTRLVDDLLASETVTLPYSFYENSMAATLNNGIEALCASYIYAHDGIPHLFKLYWYDTEATITDEDVESWEISQSSVAVYDSLNVYAMLPTLQKNSTLLSISQQTISQGDVFEYSTARVYNTTLVRFSSGEYTDPGTPYVFSRYTANILNFSWNSYQQTCDSLEVLGNVVGLAPQLYSNIAGKSPYEIKDNGYIPTLARARYIYTYLSQYIFEKYFIIEATFRGCYGFWIGAKLHVTSEMYDIDGEYIITAISFDYTGSVHTTLTLQRIG